MKNTTRQDYLNILRDELDKSFPDEQVFARLSVDDVTAVMDAFVKASSAWLDRKREGDSVLSMTKLSGHQFMPQQDAEFCNFSAPGEGFCGRPKDNAIHF